SRVRWCDGTWTVSLLGDVVRRGFEGAVRLLEQLLLILGRPGMLVQIGLQRERAAGQLRDGKVVVDPFLRALVEPQDLGLDGQSAELVRIGVVAEQAESLVLADRKSVV